MPRSHNSQRGGALQFRPLAEVRGFGLKLSPFFCRLERLFVALAYFVAANLVRYALTRGEAGIPLVEAGYAAAPIVLWAMVRINAPWIATVILTLFAALIATTADVVAIISRQYHWMPDAISGYLDAWQDLPWRVIRPIIVLIVLAALFSSLVLTIRGARRIAIWPLIALLALLAATDALAGASRWRDTTSGYDIVTVSSITIPANTLIAGLAAPQVRPVGQPSMAGNLRGATNLPPGILSVAVESFGLARLPAERHALIAPLVDRLAPFYRVTQSAHRFEGTTLAGELRELCGLATTGVPRVDEPALRACLPAHLAAAGYATTALHGNGGAIYNRARLYPAVGFADLWFYDRLHRADPAATQCPGKAFEGICDGRVFSRALSLFDGRKRFVHVMTLDAHLPVIRLQDPSCPTVFGDDAALCSYVDTTRASFAALSAAVIGASHRPDLIVVYGDHAPPFSAASVQAHFADDATPYVVLRRR